MGAGYGPKQVVFDVDLKVRAGEIVTLMGHNGAGKSTILKTDTRHVAGQGRHGRLRLVRHHPHEHQAPGGRGHRARSERDGSSFLTSTVRENLLLVAGSAKKRDERLGFVTDLFPILGERSRQLAGTLSGGQQRMLSLAVYARRRTAPV